MLINTTNGFALHVNNVATPTNGLNTDVDNPTNTTTTTSEHNLFDQIMWNYLEVCCFFSRFGHVTFMDCHQYSVYPIILILVHYNNSDHEMMTFDQIQSFISIPNIHWYLPCK